MIQIITRILYWEQKGTNLYVRLHKLNIKCNHVAHQFLCKNVIISSWLYLPIAAWWRTVRLYLSWHIRVSGHLCWSIFTMLIDPYSTAMCVGISPLLLAWLMFAPLSIKSCTTSSLLPSQARCSGVLPHWSDAWSTSFKLRIITLATSLCPFRQAICSGVLFLLASQASDSWGLCWISSRTTLHTKQNQWTTWSHAVLTMLLL